MGGKRNGDRGVVREEECIGHYSPIRPYSLTDLLPYSQIHLHWSYSTRLQYKDAYQNTIPNVSAIILSTNVQIYTKHTYKHMHTHVCTYIITHPPTITYTSASNDQLSDCMGVYMSFLLAARVNCHHR